MLTANQTNIQTAIRLEESHLGYRVFLGTDDTQLMGCIEVYPACFADIVPAGVSPKDDVYIADHAPYARLDAAVAAVTAKWLVEGRLNLPDYN